MITKQKTAEIVQKFGKSPKDSGSAEVQVAILTERILNLTPHFEKNKKDYHSMRGMMKLIGQRKSLLKYLSHNNPERYQKVIADLGLRK